MSHDQNFKNLILDYPREALAFLAEAEARQLSPEVRIVSFRQGCMISERWSGNVGAPRSG